MGAGEVGAVFKLLKLFLLLPMYAMVAAVMLPVDLIRLSCGYRHCWPRFLGWAGIVCTVLFLFSPTDPETVAAVQSREFSLFLYLFPTGLFFMASRSGEEGTSPLFAWRPPNPLPTRNLGWWSTGTNSNRREKHLRGSQIVPSRANRKARSTHLAIGEARIDPGNECQHFLISGRTGAGKSQAIYGLLATIAERRQPAFIADPGGGYLARFGSLDAVILNPFDQRDAGWSPFLEIHNDYDCERIAKATVPDADGDARQWHFYAQSLLAECLRVLWRRNNYSVKELLRMVTSADRAELAAALAGTPAQPITQAGAERMLGSTRSIIATHMAGWRYLPDQGSFSIREWIRQCAAGQGKWLFAVYRDDQMALLRLLIACWIDIAVIELLSQPESPNRRVWFVLDEMDSLGKIGAMRDGLTKLRKYGGSVISGLQTIAQLRTTYGRDEAQVLLSCLSTKLILAAGDAETAKYFEEQLGQQEVKRTSISNGRSRGAQSSTSRNVSEQHHLQATVLASQITSLPDLNGFVQTCAGSLLSVTLPYRDLPRTVPEFLPRESS